MKLIMNNFDKMSLEELQEKEDEILSLLPVGGEYDNKPETDEEQKNVELEGAKTITQEGEPDKEPEQGDTEEKETERETETETETEAEAEPELKENSDEEIIDLGDFKYDKKTKTLKIKRKILGTEIEEALPIDKIDELLTPKKPEQVLPDGITPEDIEMLKKLKAGDKTVLEQFLPKEEGFFDTEQPQTNQMQTQPQPDVVNQELYTRVEYLAKNEPEVFNAVNEIVEKRIIPQEVTEFFVKEPKAFDVFTEMLRAGDFIKYYPQVAERYKTDNSFRYAVSLNPVEYFAEFVRVMNTQQQPVQAQPVATPQPQPVERRTTSRIPNATPTNANEKIVDLNKFKTLDDFNKHEDEILDRLFKQ